MSRIVDLELTENLTDKRLGVTSGSVSRLSGVSTMDADNVLQTYRGDRTQLVQYSHELDNAWWTKTNCSISVNAVANPVDGTTTADKWVEDSSNDNHRLRRSMSWVSGDYYFFSVYAKAGERTAIHLRLDTTAFPASAQADFNLSTGASSGDSGLTTLGMEDEGDGWYRCWILAQADVTGAAYVYLFMQNPYQTESYQGNGSSGLYLFGAQLEKLEGPIQGTGVELVTDGTFDDVTDDAGEMDSGSLTVGKCYKISAQDGEDFTADGAPDNNVGTYFNCTGTNVTLDANDKVFPVTFDSWTAGDGWSPQAVAGSLTNKLAVNATDNFIYQTSVAPNNLYYLVSVTVSDYSSGTARLYLGNSAKLSLTGDGSFSAVQKSTADTHLYIDESGGFVGTIDSITVEEVTAPGPLEPGTYTATSGSTASIPAEAPYGENGYQHQGAGINYCLHNQDFSDATWAKTNMTTGSATGLDGTSDTIRLTASAANATCLQTITTLSSAEHTTSVYVKRVTGTGAVYLTDNNDSNRTELTGLSSAAWTRFDIQRTQTDPVVGIKIATDTDAVDVDIFMVEEAQSYPSAPIITDDVPVARATSQDYPSFTMGSALKATFSDAEGGADSSGTVIFELNTGYAEANGSGNANLVSWNSSATSGIYIDHAGNTLEITDGTNTATVAFAHVADTDYTVGAYWDKGADDLNIGFGASGTWTWGTAQAYDDVQAFGTDLEIAKDNEYPFDMKNLVFFDSAMTEKAIEDFEYDGQQFLLRTLLGMV